MIQKPFTNLRQTFLLLLGMLLTLFIIGENRAVLAQSSDEQGKTEETKAEKGERLVRELGCVACHEINGSSTKIKEEAPHLTYEGEIVRFDWLFSFLKKPHKIRPAIKARMPDFRLTDRESLVIAQYLAGLRNKGDPVAPEYRYPRKGAPQEVEAAKKLVSNDYFNCFNCHIAGDKRPTGKPEEWAPDLTKVKGRINPDFLFQWLRGPDKYRPGTKMPAFFPDNDSGPDDILGGDEMKQMAVIRDFLMGLGKDERFTAYAEAKAKYPDVTSSEGRRLVMKLNCVGCHVVAVLPDGKKVGPNLTYEGSRVRKEWLMDFLKAPYTIKPEYDLMGNHTRMPTFHLTEAELLAVVEYITRVLVDKESERTAPPEPALASQGEKIFREKKCHSCHRINDKPAGIGPELTNAGQRLRPGWVVNFVQRPEHYLDTRMPNLKVSPDEAKALASYILGPKR